MPQSTYCGTYEYTCNGVNGDGTINGSPTDSTVPLPALNNVPLRSSTIGGSSKPTAGNKFLVRFINQDPSRPIVVGCDPLVESVTIDASQTVNIGPSVQQAVVIAGGTAPAARMSDSVAVYFPTTPITIAGTMVIPAPTMVSFTGTLVITANGTGIITSGQPKVQE